MAGLVRKDMYCLRKTLKLFFIVTVSVIVLSVLLIASSRYGNIAAGLEEMKAEGAVDEEAFYSFFKVPIWLTLFIPLSFLSMIVECFKEDQKAGFAKIVRSMPLSCRQIVGGRYLSCLLFAAAGLAGSLTAGYFVSLVSEAFPLKELLAYILCFGGLLFIYMSFVLFMLYLFGVERADLIQCAPFLLLIIGAVLAVQKNLSSVPESEADAFFSGMIDSAANFMTEHFVLVFLAAAGCMLLSFAGSCLVFKGRKGGI